MRSGRAEGAGKARSGLAQGQAAAAFAAAPRRLRAQAVRCGAEDAELQGARRQGRKPRANDP